MSEYVNVFDYGAVGDGTTDDTAAIQAALSAGAGKVVFFPAGFTYRISRLSIPDRTTLMGYGAVLFRNILGTGGFRNAMIENASVPGVNIAAIGLELRQDIATQSRQILAFKQVTGLTVRDVFVSQQTSIGWATDFIDCQDMLIHGYRQDAGTENGQDGIHVEGGRKIVISGARITSGDDCIALTCTASTADATMDIEDVTITGAVCESVGARALAIAIVGSTTRKIRRIRVNGLAGRTNTDGESGSCIGVQDEAVGLGIEDVSIENAALRNFSTEVGGALQPGVRALSVNGLRLSNVRVQDSYNHGFHVDRCQNVVAVGCESDGTRNVGRGFMIDGSHGTKLIACRSRNPVAGTHHFQVGANNVANDCQLLACESEGGTGTGVLIQDSSRTTITGCRIATGGNGITEFVASGSVDGSRIIDNDLTGVTGTKLTLVGPNSWAERNRGLDAVGISTAHGDADATLIPRTSAPVQWWNSPLTADRSAILSTAGARAGMTFRIIRTAASTGAFHLFVGAGPLTRLAPGEWCDVVYNGTAWMLAARGSLLQRSNHGTASVADGGTIAHGLGVTPTFVALTPRVGGRIAAVAGVTSSSITIDLKDHAGNDITTPENVMWRAEV